MSDHPPAGGPPEPHFSRDLLAGLALLALLFIGWLALFDTFDVVAGLALLALMIMPFAILGMAIVRDIKKPHRGAPPPPRHREDS